MMSVKEATYAGESAILLQNGDYEAILLPKRGGNLVAFRDVKRGYRFLREPEQEMDQFEKSPIRFGIPVLFPPNRYRDGVFTVAGRTYHLPVNEESTHNHLHGFFSRLAWPVVASGDNAEGAFVEIRHDVDENHPVYEHWPHRFSISIRYTLTTSSLVQTVHIENTGDTPMPCMLGFHTAVLVPFAPSSSAADCTFTLTIGERWQLDERKLPTGRFQPLNAGEQNMKSGGVSPFFEAMDNHYSAAPVDGHNQMVLTDSKAGVRFIYDVDLGYRHWMVWNNNAGGTFFCPEPQINMVNAPNVELPADVTGLVILQPGESWTGTSRMYAESF